MLTQEVIASHETGPNIKDSYIECLQKIPNFHHFLNNLKIDLAQLAIIGQVFR